MKAGVPTRPSPITAGDPCEREAEVHDLGHPGDEDHVLGLKIAVDEAGGMNGRESLTDAAERRQDALRRWRCLAQPVLQRHAELHGDEEAAVLPWQQLEHAEVVNRHDVRVGDLRQCQSLSLDRPGERIVGQAGEQLQGDRSLELDLQSSAHHAARPVAEHSLDHEPLVGADHRPLRKIRGQDLVAEPTLQPLDRFRLVREGQGSHDGPTLRQSGARPPPWVSG